MTRVGWHVGRRTAFGLLLVGSASGRARAETWPTKPVKIVAPFAAGGNVDVTARIVAEHLQPLLGQPVIVENKTGAGSLIGSEAVARSAPDGYTLLMTSASLTNSPALFNRYPYDWQKDFAFITAVSFQPLVLLVGANAPDKTFAAFLERGAARAGQAHHGHGGRRVLHPPARPAAGAARRPALRGGTLPRHRPRPRRPDGRSDQFPVRADRHGAADDQ